MLLGGHNAQGTALFAKWLNMPSPCERSSSQGLLALLPALSAPTSTAQRMVGAGPRSCSFILMCWRTRRCL